MVLDGSKQTKEVQKCERHGGWSETTPHRLPRTMRSAMTVEGKHTRNWTPKQAGCGVRRNGSR